MWYQDPRFVTSYSAWAVHSGDIGVARRGDINLDTRVNVADVLLALRHLLGLSTLGTVQIANGDLYPQTGDGQFTVSGYLLLIENVFTR